MARTINTGNRGNGLRVRPSIVARTEKRHDQGKHRGKENQGTSCVRCQDNIKRRKAVESAVKA